MRETRDDKNVDILTNYVTPERSAFKPVARRVSCVVIERSYKYLQ